MALRDLDIDVDIDVDESGLSAANRKVDELVRSLERLDRDYRIKVDVDLGSALMQVQALDQQLDALRNQNIDIEVDTLGAKTEVAALNAELNALRDHRINIDVDTDTMDVLDDIIALEAILKDLERERIKIHFDANLEAALADLAALETMAESLSRERHDIELDVDISRALTKVTTLEEKIHALDNITVNIDVDIGAAAAQLAALQNQMVMLRMQRHINIDMDVASAMAQVAALQAQIAALQAQAGSLNLGGGLGGGMGGLAVPGLGIGVKLVGLAIALPLVASLAQVAIGVLGTLGVTIGIVAGAALSLASALAIGGAGLMGFGAIAISSIAALYEEKAKLNAQQLQLKAQTDKVADSWNRLKDAMQPTVLDATTNAVKAINNLLNVSEPILKKVGTATSGLMENFNKSLKGSEMKDFFGMLKRDIGPITTNLGNGFGNALKGVANTMTAFAPLTRWVGQGFENAMGRFSNWTAGLKDSAGLRSFITYTQQNLPKVGSALKDATKGITNFFAAFGTSASGGLDWFKDLMADFNTWSSGLGENQGFQDMLKSISTEGPAAAEVIGNISSSVMELTGALGKIGAIDALSNLTDLGDVDFLSWEHIWDSVKMPWNVAGDMFSGLGDAIGEALSNAFNGLGAKLYESIKGSDMPSVLKDALLGVFEDFNPEVPDSVTDGMAKDFTSKLSNSLKNGSLDSGTITNDLVKDSTSALEKQLSIFKPKVEVDADTSKAKQKTSEVGKDTKAEVAVGADVTPAQATMKSMTAEEIQAKVNADTAAAQSKLLALEATPIKISTDTSAIAANIGSMAATIALKADTSTITNSIQNMPEATVKLTADTASLTNSIGNLPDAQITLTAEKIDITNNIQVVDVPVNPILQQTSGLFGTTPTTVNVTPKFTETPTIDDVTANVTFDYEQPSIDDVSVNLKFDYEQPNIDPVTVKAKLQVDKSGLGNLTSGTKVNFGPMPKFSWPPLPKMSWPALPKFSWPSMPKFSWPPLPKWSWPPMPKFSWPPMPRFSWPPMPRFSWPPMPTVKVSVSGAGAHGSHASGLGKVPFDNYVGNLHKDEAIIPASDANNLRAAGVLSGDGSNPTVNPLAASTAVPTPVASSHGGGAVTVKIDAPITVKGGNTNSETAQNLKEAMEQFWNDKYEQFAGIFDGELEY